MPDASMFAKARAFETKRPIVRVLDGLVKNKYANDPGKLGAWISASHV